MSKKLVDKKKKPAKLGTTKETTMTDPTAFPCLYVLVNTDLASMNPGKAQAHSGHAANAFVEKAVIAPLLAGKTPDALVMTWRTATPQGFGTQINLKAPTRDLSPLVDVAVKLGFAAELVFDPTYPYEVTREMFDLIPQETHTLAPVFKGDTVICFRRQMTAAYVFGDKNNLLLNMITSRYPLHP